MMMQPFATTDAIRVGQFHDLSDVHCEPIALSSAYVFASAADAAEKFSGVTSGNVYSRFTNPTVGAFEQRLAALERAAGCVAFASGMAAICAIAHAFLQAGSNVVCSRDVFGTTLTAFRHYFGKLGVELRVASLTELADWQSKVDEQTRLVFLETPSNPMQQVGDIRAIANIAHAVGALLVVDNTMLTPVYQKPLSLGADMVVHSAGKYIDGQGRCLAGAVLGSERLMDDLRGVLRAMGASLSAMNAWLLLRSMETLELRVRAISQSTLALANFLGGCHGVGRVFYSGLAHHPQRSLITQQQAGFGGVLSFEVGATRAHAWRVIDHLKLISIATNIGETRSMVTHPASTTHCKLSREERQAVGISEQLLRISVGLEHIDDLQADLQQALRLLPDAAMVCEPSCEQWA